MNPQDEPRPESHWYPSDPSAQPPHDAVLSLTRLVQEARAELGPGADPGAICEVLKRRGVDVTAEQVRHVCRAG